FLRQKQKKLIMLPSEIMIWQPEFTDKILSRKPGAVQNYRVFAFSAHTIRAYTSYSIVIFLSMRPTPFTCK
ncbi:hypothetical protein ACS1ZU_005190, partial [Escherichia coli]